MQYPPIRKLKTISKNENRLFNCAFAIAVCVSLFVFADDLLNGRQLVGFGKILLVQTVIVMPPLYVLSKWNESRRRRLITQAIAELGLTIHMAHWEKEPLNLLALDTAQCKIALLRAENDYAPIVIDKADILQCRIVTDSKDCTCSSGFIWGNYFSESVSVESKETYTLEIHYKERDRTVHILQLPFGKDRITAESLSQTIHLFGIGI